MLRSFSRRAGAVALAGKWRAPVAAISHRHRLETLEARTLLSDYFVAPSGSDTGNGSDAAPWKTLQKAADNVHAGDSVTVGPGEYAGFVLTSSHSGTADNRITFTADPGVNIESPSRFPDGINLEGASYVTIEGFTIQNPFGKITRAGIRSVTNSNVIIRNNHVDGMGRWGIFSGFSDDLLVENNITSHSIGEHGIYLSNSGDRPVIRGNISFGNRNAGIQLNGDASQGGDGIISNALLENNIIFDNGINGGSAINCDGVQESVFRNNLLYNNHVSGISLFRMGGGEPSTGNLVVNNTIINAPNARWCVNINGGSVGNTVLNNILDNRNPSRGAITIASDSLSGFRSDYNVIINNNFLNGSTNMTLRQWTDITGQDAHSRVSTEDASFADPDQDFHLFEGSSPVDAGTMEDAPGSDLDGNPRPRGSGIDIGSFEFQTAEPPAAREVGGALRLSRPIVLTALSTTQS